MRIFSSRYAFEGALALMADGQPNLCSKKLVDFSHAFLGRDLELSANQHIYRVANIVDKRIMLLEKYILQLPKT